MQIYDTVFLCVVKGKSLYKRNEHWQVRNTNIAGFVGFIVMTWINITFTLVCVPTQHPLQSMPQ